MKPGHPHAHALTHTRTHTYTHNFFCQTCRETDGIGGACSPERGENGRSKILPWPGEVGGVRGWGGFPSPLQARCKGLGKGGRGDLGESFFSNQFLHLLFEPIASHSYDT
jgi:hypothetical protein